MKFFNQRFNQIILHGTRVLFIGLIVVPYAAAVTLYYRPKDLKPPILPGIPGGTQGEECSSSSSSNPFKVLAPQGFIGETVSSRPTFIWSTPFNEPLNLELTLYEFNQQARPIPVSMPPITLDARQGTWTLPNTVDKLTEGKTYMLKMIVKCDPDNSSRDLVDDVEFKVIPKSVALEQQISNASSPVMRAEIYAKEGVWYDAFAEVAAFQDTASVEMRRLLLNELEQVEQEFKNRTTPANPQSE
jgi:hypothetical protein